MGVLGCSYLTYKMTPPSGISMIVSHWNGLSVFKIIFDNIKIDYVMNKQKSGYNSVPCFLIIWFLPK